jgi:hypothetical protein
MDHLLIVKFFLIFMVFWAVGIVLLWFRPRIEVFWKIAATLIFGLYTWFFWNHIMEGVTLFLSGWYVFLISFIKETLTLVFVNFFFIWPLSLVIIFYKSDDMGAERLLKYLSVITLTLWILFIIYYFFHKGIDGFLINRLKEMIPYAQ